MRIFRYDIHSRLPIAVMAISTAVGGPMAHAHDETRDGLKIEHFDRDPGWDGHNNRLAPQKPPVVKQDFGYSKTSRASSAASEIGGLISPAAEPAYYAKAMPAKTLDEALSASGTLTVAEGSSHVLIGFFNAGTINDWRTPNTLALRINGRGKTFHAYVDYATRRWRAGGGRFGPFDAAKGRKLPHEFASGATVHTWSLAYDPSGDGGCGTIMAMLDDQKVVVNLMAGHKLEGASFNRFGLLNVLKAAGGSGSLWVGNLVLNGVAEPLDRDPGWEGFQNRRTYTTTNVRPCFDFGFSPTRFAGGKAAGELGGLVFRGDERFPERMAYCGDRVGPLTLDRPLRASGKVCLRRGVTDSSTLFGFFHATESMRTSRAQKSAIPENFLGIAIEGPSQEGFLFYPAYGLNRDSLGSAGRRVGQPPHILPDGVAHDWTLEYSPAAADGQGRITVTLDGHAAHLDLRPGEKTIGAQFNRFGIITTHIDGNGQHVYLDDMAYTAASE